MNWYVVWTREAEKDLARLDELTRHRIRRAVERFADVGHGDVRRLQGHDEEYRLRVGPWLVHASPSAVRD